jgi:hypothetical protein
VVCSITISFAPLFSLFLSLSCIISIMSLLAVAFSLVSGLGLLLLLLVVLALALVLTIDPFAAGCSCGFGFGGGCGCECSSRGKRDRVGRDGAVEVGVQVVGGTVSVVGAVDVDVDAVEDGRVDDEVEVWFPLFN